MKNPLLFASALALVVTSMVSCKKEYTCECSKTYTSGSGTTTKDYSVYTYKENRVRAEERCNANSATGSDIWGDYSINCQIR
ncbi:MAG: hypothetical protein H0V01_00010 [Bacteroidetes bacterium]|nr:hypothetical protein [Bacteroidota bacterium]HET6243456.1 hypothetical protein [Bacteroidia bacterium]